MAAQELRADVVPTKWKVVMPNDEGVRKDKHIYIYIHTSID